jgi:hypothetical protein
MAITNGTNGNGATNGSGPSARVLKAGVWAPSPAFFTEDEELGESEHCVSSTVFCTVPTLAPIVSVVVAAA